MNIITISREFGSGGREIGKRLADILGYDYYDREILTEIAKRNNVEENYVDYALNNNIWQTFSLTFNHSFVSPIAIATPDVELLHDQKKVIEEIAEAGRNCVIVGRNADVILSEKNPLNLFICADMKTKIGRCMERAEKDEVLSEKEIMKMIKRIEKNRARTRSIIADGEWGDRKSYNLIINTTGWDIKVLSKVIASYAETWFNGGKKD